MPIMLYPKLRRQHKNFLYLSMLLKELLKNLIEKKDQSGHKTYFMFEYLSMQANGYAVVLTGDVGFIPTVRGGCVSEEWQCPTLQ